MEENNQTNELTVNTVDINPVTQTEEIPEMITNDGEVDNTVTNNIEGFNYTNISSNSDIPSFEPEPVNNIAGIPSFETTTNPNPVEITYDDSNVGTVLSSNVEAKSIVLDATTDIPTTPVVEAPTTDVPTAPVVETPVIDIPTEPVIEPVAAEEVQPVEVQTSLTEPIADMPEQVEIIPAGAIATEDEPIDNTIVDSKIDPSTLFGVDINTETGIESPTELSNTPQMFEYQNNIQDKSMAGVDRDELIGNYNSGMNYQAGDSVATTFEEQISNAQDLNVMAPPPVRETPIPQAQVNNTVNVTPVVTAPVQNTTPINYAPKDNLILKNPNNNSTGPSPFKQKSPWPHRIAFAFIYLIVIGVVAMLGYKVYMSKQQMQLRKSNIQLALGSSYQEIIYIKGERQDNNDYEWKIENENVVSVTDGKIKGLAEGETTIDVISKKTKQSETINVHVMKVEVESITVDKKEQTISATRPYTITPIINGQSKIIMDLEWKSSNPDIAEVSDEGIVNPKGKGTVTITITVPNTDKSVDVLLGIN